MARLGVSRLDLMYAHIEDPSVPVSESVGAFGGLVASGEVGLLGAVNQVVLSWLMGGEIPVIPLVGASSVAQLEESLAAVDLELSAAQRERLDQAH